jgi:hypothetical protein
LEVEDGENEEGEEEEEGEENKDKEEGEQEEGEGEEEEEGELPDRTTLLKSMMEVRVPKVASSSTRGSITSFR